MHLADGVISMPVVAATSAVTGGLLYYSSRGVTEEEVPRISLITAAFFVSSLISIPVGPSAVHPMLGGLLGLILKRRAPLAIFVGLLLQALLFQHGGLSTLGANTLIFSIPALLVYTFLGRNQKISLFPKGAAAGSSSILLGLVFLVGFLFLTDQRYAEGFFSVINLLVVAHLPLAAIEGVLTGFALKFLHSVKPDLLSNDINSG